VVVATELGLELARQGHEVHFITYSQPVLFLNANVHYHEVNVPEYPFIINLMSLLYLANLLIWSNYIRLKSCMHDACYTSCLCWIYGQADVKSEGIKIPMVTTLHGTDITLVGNHPFTSLQ
jgi:UDP:flavonoid glycosyltransferase YjiC (YdhE family)